MDKLSLYIRYFIHLFCGYHSVSGLGYVSGIDLCRQIVNVFSPEKTVLHPGKSDLKFLLVQAKRVIRMVLSVLVTA